VARALIVGCGCRGRMLGRRLLAEGWAVRGTSRRDEGLGPIEAAGIEAALADPERPGTVLELVGDVAVVHWLLGSAVGEPESVEAIHGAGLERVLERLVETPVRGFVYDADGTVEGGVLERGAAVVRGAAERWRIPVALPALEGLSPKAWTEAMFSATLGLTAQDQAGNPNRAKLR
jgi:nucleoside-diphosphate-sugar epimerase